MNNIATKIFMCVIVLTLLLLMVIILVKSVIHLLIKKSFTIENKHAFVQTIDKNKTNKIKRKNNVATTFKPYIRYATFFSLFAFSVGIVCAVTDMIVLIIIQQKPHYQGWLLTVSFSVWLIGRILMNTIFMYRLKFSFINTIYMYNNKVFICLYSIIISIIGMVTICVILMISQAIAVASNNQFIADILIQINTLFFGLMILFDMICCIILTILFQKKVFELIKSYFISFEHAVNSQNTMDDLLTLEISENENENQERTHSTVSLQQCNNISTDVSTNKSKSKTIFRNHIISDSIVVDEMNGGKHVFNMIDNSQNIMNKNVKYMTKAFDHTKLELINNITQYTILISISLITSCFVLIFGVINSKEFYDQDKKGRLDIWFGWQFMVAVDCFLNSCCLYLHFPFSLKLYKCVCGRTWCPHKMCLLIITRTVDECIIGKK
eukprot:523372_1